VLLEELQYFLLLLHLALRIRTTSHKLVERNGEAQMCAVCTKEV